MLARGMPWFIIIPPAVTLAVVATIVVSPVPVGWGAWALVVVLAVASAFGLAFFRDPERTCAEGLLAPAHGRVMAVEDVDDGDAWTRVSIFMGPFDVHVVRAPLDGKVAGIERGGATFARADTPGADHNVRLTLTMDPKRLGEHHRVVLVSGWFARRIVPYVAVGDKVARGARIGLIRFGSRVDVLVPRGMFTISVGRGQRVRASETSLGVRADARR
jgi:phosphatidylserine decarboxylase